MILPNVKRAGSSYRSLIFPNQSRAPFTSKPIRNNVFGKRPSYHIINGVSYRIHGTTNGECIIKEIVKGNMGNASILEEGGTAIFSKNNISFYFRDGMIFFARVPDKPSQPQAGFPFRWMPTLVVETGVDGVKASRKAGKQKAVMASGTIVVDGTHVPEVMTHTALDRLL
jgi:hypothetical protein